MRRLSDGAIIHTIESNAILRKNLSLKKNLPKRVDSTENVDGFNMPVKMLLPPDMMKDKKYPFLVHVYGGPGSQTVDDRYPFTSVPIHLHGIDASYYSGGI